MFVVEDAVNPYKEIFQALRQWTNHEDYDKTIADFLNTKKLTPILETFISNNPTMEIFFNKSKNDLINTRGVWRLP